MFIIAHCSKVCLVFTQSQEKKDRKDLFICFPLLIRASEVTECNHFWTLWEMRDWILQISRMLICWNAISDSIYVNSFQAACSKLMDSWALGHVSFLCHHLASGYR